MTEEQHKNEESCERQCELQQAMEMKEEKNTLEETEGTTIGKVFLGKRKNGPRGDNY